MKNKEIIFIVLITLFVLILRLIMLLNVGGVTHDELYSMYFASQDSLFETIVKSIKEDLHTPLYFALLHLWLKIAHSDNYNLARIFSLMVSIPLIPIGYFASKKLFNNLTAIFSVIFLTINTFVIYYSIEIRFYALVLPLSLLSAYYFSKSLSDGCKKDYIFYIASITLLSYTFSITPLLALCYLIVGLLFLILNNKNEIKKFILANFIAFVLSLPAILMVLYNVCALKGNLVSYPLDIFIFNHKMFYDIVENIFTFKNQQIIENCMFPNEYKPLLLRLFDFKYIIFVFIPSLLAFGGLFKAMCFKNKKFLLFFYPSFLFLITSFLLAQLKIISLQPRYMIIIAPVMIISACFGFSLAKKKKVSIILFALFITLNLSGLINSKFEVFFLKRVQFNSLLNIVPKIEMSDDDLILIPHMGNKLSYFFKKGKFIPFSIANAAVLKDKDSLRFYFGEEADKLSRNNVKQYIAPYIIKDVPLDSFEENLYNNYLKNMKTNQKLIFLSAESDNLFFIKPQRAQCERFSLSNCLISKATRDSFLVLKKYLNLKTVFIEKNKYAVWVFEKNN